MRNPKPTKRNVFNIVWEGPPPFPHLKWKSVLGPPSTVLMWRLQELGIPLKEAMPIVGWMDENRTLLTIKITEYED